MKAVVFGGSGFLGSHVADELSSRGYEVAVFDKIESRHLARNQTMVAGDILDRQQVNSAVAGSDFVYNYAGIADLDNAATRPVDTVMLNVAGTCNILDACVEHGVKRFIYASSFYANSDKGGFYRCSKQSAEIYIEEYGRKFGLEYTILRYGSLYGPRADMNNGMKKMIGEALASGEIHCPGTGNDMREYIHVQDAAGLSVDILDERYADKHLQLTGNAAYSRRQIAELIGEILGKRIKASFDETESELHYNVTPYTYKPQINYKLVSTCYHDLGQGIIECMREIEENDDRHQLSLQGINGDLPEQS